ncbi:hypothetical protein ACFY36_07625 [Actinoplanes sp. NPDC000266]
MPPAADKSSAPSHSDGDLPGPGSHPKSSPPWNDSHGGPAGIHVEGKMPESGLRSRGGPTERITRSRGGPTERMARAGVAIAARRWPKDLADEMRDTWLAELAALEGPGRARKRLVFVASLLVSPAVDEASWRERGEAFGRAAMVAGGVTLLAAASANAIRSGGEALLLLGVLTFAAIGARLQARASRSEPSTPDDRFGSTAPDGGPQSAASGGGSAASGRGPGLAAVVGLLGVAMFGFLVAGNQVAVMPFMGVRDVAPSVAVWTVGTAVVVRLVQRLAAAGQRGRAVWLAAGGGLITLDMAVAAGSLHAAASVGVSAWSTPAWFPLALLPGGTVSFGPHFADGAAAFGSLQAYGPAFHASEILLANAAVMAGPLLLISAFTAAAALRTAPTPQSTDSRASSGWRQFLTGSAAAIAAIALCPLLADHGGDAEATLRRMLDNSTEFGFGFAAHPAGQGAIALLAALLVMGAASRRQA